MFSRKKPSPPADTKLSSPRKSGSSIPSIIASDLHILGNIVGGGTVDIDGRVEGNVRCQVATVRKNGHIKGDLIAESISIYGRVQGLIKARSVHFFKGCKVEGVIHHETITIEDGAFVDGRFKRTDRVVLDEAEVPALEAPGRHPFHAQFQPAPILNALAEDELHHGETLENTPAEPRDPKDEKHSLKMLNLKLMGDAN